MTTKEMRAIISDSYPGERWKRRCAAMPRNQVCAIYYSLLSRDRNKQKKKDSERQVKQLTIFDFM